MRDQDGGTGGLSFGVRLRSLRERAGLTQEELAERAGVTTHAVSALERGARRRPYPHTVRSLAGALGISADDRASLLAAIPKRAAAPSAVDAGPIRALPAATTALVGRDRDVSAVVGLLRGHRLVTLTGIGGVGKTSLGLAVGRTLTGDFPDGVAFVPLAPVADAAEVTAAVGQAVGAAGPAVADHLRELRLLLVLDNFEHVTDAAPQVATLLAECPQLTVLATSRAALRLRGEVEYPVRPLTVPESTSVADVEGSPAGHLFVARAGAVAPRFRLTEANAGAVATICRRLAGIPLALELAAARVRLLDPAGLLARLDEAMAGEGARDLPARQRTLQATLAWSYDLLSEPERRLFRRLAVFVDGFTLTAAEAVASDVDGVLTPLERLVEQSLVTVDRDGRYRMLEPVAQYARGRLGTGTEAVAAGRAHAAYFLALAERAGPEYQKENQLEWLARVEADDGNMVAAIRFALAHGDGATASRLCWALWLYWWLRGHLRLGRALAESTLEHPLPDPLRGRTLSVAAAMSFAQGDNAAARKWWTASCAVAGDEPVSYAHALPGVGLTALADGDLAAAEDVFRRSLTATAAIGPAGDWVGSLTEVWLGTVLMLRGEPGEATTHIERGLASARRRGDRLVTYIALFNLSQASIGQGDHARARVHLAEGIRLSEQTRDLANLAYFLDALAVVEDSAARPERVPTLLGAAQALRETVGSNVYGYYQPDEALRTAAAANARKALGDDAYDDALDQGRSFDLDEAVAYALIP